MFTLIYVGGLALVILLLLLGLVRNRRRPVSTAAIPADLPKAVKKRLGSTSTNRGLRALRWLFVLLSVGIYSFHVYWAQYAADRNDKFQELSYKDLRTRRLSESTLRGWILDRNGRCCSQDWQAEPAFVRKPGRSSKLALIRHAACNHES